jgi:hypothetical protein
VSLVARHLEAAGVATVIIGSARDIVEECGVPRFVFTDLPLGNPMGPPFDRHTQRRTLDVALDLARTAAHPRTTVQAPARWPDDDWRRTYMRVDDDNRAELLAAGEARRAAQARRGEPDRSN